MANISIKLISKEIRITVDNLVKYLSDIGIKKSKYDYISKHERRLLFTCLKSHLYKDCIIFKRKTKSTLNVFNVNGKNRTINVEVRKQIIDINKLINKNKISITKNKYDYLSCNDTENLNNKYCTVFNKKIKEIHTISTEEFKANDNNKQQKKIDSNTVDYNNKIIDETNNIKHTIDENKKSRYTFDKYHNVNKCQKELNIKHKNVTHKKIEEMNIIKKIKPDTINLYNKKSNSSSCNSSIEEIKCDIQKHTNKRYISENVYTKKEFINKDKITEMSKDIKSTQKKNVKTIKKITNKTCADTKDLNVNKSATTSALNADTAVTNNNISIKTRPPVVTFMGHIDHGKTSILDRIRTSNVVSYEIGNITQHVKAYHFVNEKYKITFLDTPGHSAFNIIKSKELKITDIVVLVIAADDGIMPQSIESIRCAQKEKIPIIVAINKIDLHSSSDKKIKYELTKYNLLPEEWGGETIFINISAKTGVGINDLLQAIKLQSDILELKSNYHGVPKGVVIESFLDKGQGAIAIILIQEGTLKKGDVILCGLEYGRIRNIKNENGKELYRAYPSMPVMVTGLSGIPSIGDKMEGVKSEKLAKNIACERQIKFKSLRLLKQKKSTLIEDFSSLHKKNKKHFIYLIIKADTTGSVDSITNSILHLPNSLKILKIIYSGTGNITETDINLALNVNADIIGFNVKTENSAKKMLHLENIRLKCYSIIYDIIDDVNIKINNYIHSNKTKKTIASAEVKNIFNFDKNDIIAGCLIKYGVIKQNSNLTILRKNKIIHEGKLKSIKHFKDNIKEARAGMECGICIKDFNNLLPGDVIKIFEK